jgi:hypothetical protein
MASYKYLSLELGVNFISVQSTDPEVVEQLLAELRKLISFQVRALDWSKLPSGEPSVWHLDKFKERAYPAHCWMVKQLCLQGWEPFAIEWIAHFDQTITALKFRDERS